MAVDLQVHEGGKNPKDLKNLLHRLQTRAPARLVSYVPNVTYK